MLEVFLVVVVWFLLLPAAVFAVAMIIDALLDPMTKLKNLLERRQQRRPVDWQNYSDLK